MKFTFTNLDIWSSGDTAYFKRSDGNLLSFHCDDMPLLYDVIRCIGEGVDAEGRRYPEDFLEKEAPARLVRFLSDNGILSCTDPSECPSALIGFYGDPRVGEDFQKIWQDEGLPHRLQGLESPDRLEGLDLVLVVAPAFDDKSFLETLSTASYRKELPLLYAEIAPGAVTIGPLVFPEYHTPSLQCYLKRKSVNLSNPALYQPFIADQDKVLLHRCDPREHSCYALSRGLILRETEWLLRHRGHYSEHLMGKSHHVDFLSYRIETSRILKDPVSPLFYPIPNLPFNA